MRTGQNRQWSKIGLLAGIEGEPMTEGFDTQVRVELYREFVRTARAPTSESLAEKMQVTADEVRASLERLAAARAIVLQPESREVLMANPLSAVPTPYQIRAGDRSYFGSCVWDALGVIAMLQRDAVLDSSCACCGEAMSIAVSGGRAAPARGIIHFAVPAKRWWENIVFT
jgi:Alkylmercury lyase